MKSRFSLLITLIFLCSCAGKKRTEEQQYRDMQDTFKYSAYNKISKNTVNPLLKVVNKELKKDDKTEVRPELVHSLAAVAMSFFEDSKLALVEADLAVRDAKDDLGKYVAHSALSVAMFSHGWQGLGTKQHAKVKLLENSEAIEREHGGTRVAAKVVLGLSAIMNKDGPSAEAYFAELAASSGYNWLPLTAHAAAIMMEGPGLTTLSRLKELEDRADTSFAEKEKLAILQELATDKDTSTEAMKQKASKLVTQWSMDALTEAGNNSKEPGKENEESTLSATVNAVQKVLAALQLAN